MQSVWVVTAGSYSDYHIVAIFAEEADAKAFSASHYDSEYEKWELDTWQPEQVQYRFTFNLEGTITDTREESYTEPLKSDEPECYVQYQSVPPHDRRTYEATGISVTVARGPKDLATKIASERYTRLRAVLDEAERIVPQGTEFRYCLVQPIAAILAGLQAIPEDNSIQSIRVRELLAGRKGTKWAGKATCE